MKNDVVRNKVHRCYSVHCSVKNDHQGFSYHLRKRAGSFLMPSISSCKMQMNSTNMYK